MLWRCIKGLETIEYGAFLCETLPFSWDPSCIQIPSSEMLILTIVHFIHSTPLSLPLTPYTSIFLGQPISEYFIYFLYWEHTRQQSTVNTLFVDIGRANEKKKITSFLMRWYQYLHCLVRFVRSFFIFCRCFFPLQYPRYCYYLEWN